MGTPTHRPSPLNIPRKRVPLSARPPGEPVDQIDLNTEQSLNLDTEAGARAS